MSDLGDKQRRAREQGVTHEGHRYTVRIPTHGQMEDLAESLGKARLTPRRVAQAYTVGWDLNEIDILPGGRPEPAPFEADALHEYLDDQPELCNVLFVAITDGFNARKKTAEDDEKN